MKARPILMSAAIVFAALVFGGKAQADPMRYVAHAAIITDAASTMVALDRGHKEGNPLYGHDPGDAKMIAITAARMGVIELVNRLDIADANKRAFNTAFSVVTFGVVGRNVALIKGEHQAAGIVIGISIPIGIAAYGAMK